MIIEHLVVGPFQTNVYVIGCPTTKKGAIVDAGGHGPGLLGLAKKHDLTLESILQTHAHIDHVGALGHVKEALNVPIHLHTNERELYDHVTQQGMLFGISIEPLPAVDVWLKEGQIVKVGDLRAQVLLMPGHSPGSVIFYFEEQHIMLSGDVLFYGSIGRTDLPGSNAIHMSTSLKRLKTYPDETIIYSGHGPKTTLGHEKQTNMFLNQDW